MTYVLHNRLGSGGFPVEVMLSLCGLDYHYEPIDSVPGTPLGERVHHVNRWGQVPVLVTPDGQTVTEVAAILAYLDQTEPDCRAGPHLWNDNPGQFLRWCVFLSTSVYESVLRRAFSDRYIDLADCDADEAEALKKRVADAGYARAHQAYTLIEDVLQTQAFLLGDRMSAADVYLAMLYAWHRRQPDLPNCARVAERVASHAEIHDIWKKNFDSRLKEKWNEALPHWR